jgi:Flp pilus assembly protein TadG
MSVSENKALSAAGRVRRRVLRFARDERGSNPIEFALLIFPFVLMMFAVIETGLSFAAQQVMSNATDDVSRSLRVGDILPADVSESGIKTLICGEISFLVAAGCPGLNVDLQTYASYSQVPLTIPKLPNGDLDTANFHVAPGGSGSKNQLRVFYRWPVYLDFMRKYLATMPGGKTLLYSTLTWQNEPY